ncbi:hypothetical protein [Anaerobacillus sp. 1_MG-2023]|uniref:hypothetical protein n=1 Tax=Anaerobacillus sp. 1_MG-2023 TaxID=3062655 RepID=UPI0026E2B38B|nr:hypothetical protein [Anaerobacillus sp. 1_MG-2023]MDO6654290.1 hypothetical protein [Anaerobacillus sp. 1_MG-2023]
MITKNAGTLSKAYFKSYMELVMSARECSLEEAKGYAFEQLFQNNEQANGPETYEKFKMAYAELLDKVSAEEADTLE